jgi:hypothetical protein
MSEPLIILVSSMFIAAIYFLYEVLRTVSFLKWIERPLAKPYKDWDNNIPRVKKRIRNKNFQRDFYAYDTLTQVELTGIRIIMKSYESETSFLQDVLELLWKLSLLVIAIKLMTGDELFKSFSFRDDSLNWLIAVGGVFAIVVLLQRLFTNSRKRWIHYHIMLIDQVLNSPSYKGGSFPHA